MRSAGARPGRGATERGVPGNASFAWKYAPRAVPSRGDELGRARLTHYDRLEEGRPRPLRDSRRVKGRNACLRPLERTLAAADLRKRTVRESEVPLNSA